MIVREVGQVFDRMDDASVRPLMEAVKAHKRIFLISGGHEGLATCSFAMCLIHPGNLFEQILFMLYDAMVMVLREEMGIAKEGMVARHRNVE